MAFTSGFYNSYQGDRKYTSEQMSDIFDYLITDGVLNVEQGMMVKPSTGMNVTVGIGRARKLGIWCRNDSPYLLTIDDADVSLPRVDWVCVHINKGDAVREAFLEIVKGKPSSSANSQKAIPPTVEMENYEAYIWLGSVLVQPNMTEVTAVSITNMVGTSTTPFITGILKTADISALFDEFEEQFDTWFDNVKLQLTENVVTNLQYQIDKLDSDKLGREEYQAQKATTSIVLAGTDNTRWVTAQAMNGALQRSASQIYDGSAYRPATLRAVNGRIKIPKRTEDSADIGGALPLLSIGGIPILYSRGYGKMYIYSMGNVYSTDGPVPSLLLEFTTGKDSYQPSLMFSSVRGTTGMPCLAFSIDDYGNSTTSYRGGLIWKNSSGGLSCAWTNNPFNTKATQYIFTKSGLYVMALGANTTVSKILTSGISTSTLLYTATSGTKLIYVGGAGSTMYLIQIGDDVAVQTSPVLCAVGLGTGSTLTYAAPFPDYALAYDVGLIYMCDTYSVVLVQIDSAGNKAAFKFDFATHTFIRLGTWTTMWGASTSTQYRGHHNGYHYFFTTYVNGLSSIHRLWKIVDSFLAAPVLVTKYGSSSSLSTSLGLYSDNYSVMHYENGGFVLTSRYAYLNVDDFSLILPPPGLEPSTNNPIQGVPIRGSQDIAPVCADFIYGTSDIYGAFACMPPMLTQVIEP